MVWQDITLFILNIVFAYATIPQVYRGFKDKRKYMVFLTSVTTAFAMSVQTVVYFTLGIYFAFSMSLFVTILWYMLLYQSLFFKAPEKDENMK